MPPGMPMKIPIYYLPFWSSSYKVLPDSLFVNGLGGDEAYEFDHPLVGSQVRYNADHGAMRVVATKHKITFQFIIRTEEVIDTFEVEI